MDETSTSPQANMTTPEASGAPHPASPRADARAISHPSREAIYLGLGSNVGDRIAALQGALDALAASGVAVEAVSPVYETEAHVKPGADPQRDHLNAVARVATPLAPEALLDVLHRIEREAGRDPDAEPWSPRPLDLDVLLWGDRVFCSARLVVPHPRLHERRFVLAPLADLACDLVVPGTERTVGEWLAATADSAHVERAPEALALPASGVADTPPSPAPSHPSAPSAPAPMSLALPDHLRYVAVEGVIGAGKSTLARMLAEKTDARLVLESFEDNPFLERFYADSERWAFQTQLTFLASRFRQQKVLAERDLFQTSVVSDYTFDKDRIFARVTLGGDEHRLYESLFSLMEPTIPAPDLVVYLRSSVDRLMHNVALRGRSYEAQMDPAYLAELTEAYDRYFFHYTRSPLLVVNSTQIDFVKEPSHFQELVRAIRQMKGGTTFFNPPGEMQLSF
ncbi:MAG: 2-amino-4-hydroxy-6-hydroxymethyldihydropteridine diphosphokinase [Bacteroidota bacterium]